MLYTWIVSKGTLIGLFSGILKVMQDIRTKTFKWYLALTDIFGSTIVGYTMYEWASESETLKNWQIILITVIFSLNAFVFIGVLTNPKVLGILVKKYTKIDISDEIKEDK